MFRFLKNIFFLCLFLAVCAAGSGLFLFYYYSRGLPDYQQLAKYEPPVTTRLYAKDGRMFAEYAAEKRLFLPIDAIPKRIILTFLAAEDKNFYEHKGVDFFSIIRAAFTNIQRFQSHKRPVGASTITQQVAKNFLLAEISNAVSLERKIKEAILAFRIEHAFTKDHILELYLNEIYLGGSCYGVAAAALHYFNKSLDQLTISEAAFLAGLPKAPSRYDPIRNAVAAKTRRDWVIGRMREDAMITAAEAQAAIAQPIRLHKRDPAEVVRADYFAEEVRRELVQRYGEKILYEGGLTVRTSLDPYLQPIADTVLRQGLETYDRRHGWRGPVTHLALTAMAAAEIPKEGAITSWQELLRSVAKPAGSGSWQTAIVLALAPNAAKIGFSDGAIGHIPLSELMWARRWNKGETLGPVVKDAKDVLAIGDVLLVEPLKQGQKHYRLCQIPAVSGALVALDPHTGRVLALTGGWSFEISQFNRATQAMRQMGSAYKPFVYLAALERGLTPSTIVQDAPLAINLGYGLGVWKPKNYEKDFLGPITLRRALEKSRNLAMIHIAHELVGMKRIADVAKRFGIMENMPLQLAMVLGAGETTLLNLTNAYSMLANGGKKIKPILLERVQDRHGRTLLAEESRRCSDCHEKPEPTDKPPQLADTREQVGDPVSIYQLVSILQGVIDRGTGHVVRTLVPEHPLAGKTGSTNDFKDALFVGFTPDLVVGIRIGFDDFHSLGKVHEGGARVAAPIFGQFMQRALKDVLPKPFRVPPGVRLVRVNAESGQTTTERGKGSILEAFKTHDSLTPALEGTKSGDTANDIDNDLDLPLEAPPAEEAEGIY